MEVLKKNRSVIRSSFTRLLKVIENTVASDWDECSDLDLSINLEMLEEKYVKLTKLDEEILNVMSKESEYDENDLENEMQISEEYGRKFKKINKLVKLKTAEADVTLNTSAWSEANKRKFKLPQLELKKFGGEIQDWLPFWGQFKKIDTDPDLDEADKFQYLVQATYPNTRARELVESYPASGENYKKALESLKSRFGREDLLVEYYVRELLKLTFSMNSKGVKVELFSLYDKIETQLRALESLGVTSNKYAAMLFPLVESCLTEDVLRAWQRYRDPEKFQDETRIESLMRFLKAEVENEERIKLAMKGFSKEKEVNKNTRSEIFRTPTAAGLFNGNHIHTLKCVFCEGQHSSKECKQASALSLADRNSLLAKNKCCFRCLKRGHFVKQCQSKIRCFACNRRHYRIMCPDPIEIRASNNDHLESKETEQEQFHSMMNPTCSPNVLLQTLVVVLRRGAKDLAVRALIDTGSQRSYISKKAAIKMDYQPIRKEEIVHNLFGGVEKFENHCLYKVFVSSYKRDYHCTFDALDQEKICADIPRTLDNRWKRELEKKGIVISDGIHVKDLSPSIDLLIGADIAGKLSTGKVVQLEGGLTAVETLLGWTLMGKISDNYSRKECMSVLTLHANSSCISDLWRLDTLGILDPVEKKSELELDRPTKEKKVPDTHKNTAEQLNRSMYVENCVTSLSCKEELSTFIEESKKIMALGMFDLRGWQFNVTEDVSNYVEILAEDGHESEVSVLGLRWNTNKDTLKIDIPEEDSQGTKMTERLILSRCHKIFDPIGFTSPVTLIPKVLLQGTWKIETNWDDELPLEMAGKYWKWEQQLKNLKDLEIPRWVQKEENSNHSLHVFCDASKLAYATCIFLRSENREGVYCHLIAARSRVAPIKSLTISRLELLACCIGLRLAKDIKKDLEEIGEISTFYWTDSMNCLHWIKNEEFWAPFVMNRVREIRSESEPQQWNHVPGILNPADLASRGCSVEILISRSWWEGPAWLKLSRDDWPKSMVFPDQDVVNNEKRKLIISASNVSKSFNEFLLKFSSYNDLIRHAAWLIRFVVWVTKCKRKVSLQASTICKESLMPEELKNAERKILQIVQRVSFVSENDDRLKSLQPFVDSQGLIRMKTRLLFREDSADFKCPIILPAEHPVVRSLIISKHEEMLHCGIQTLIANLRENYWVIKSRKTVRKVLNQCIRCKRFRARAAEVVTAPLPEERIRDAAIFEVTGIDLAGPLFMKDGSKSWIVLFTCAVFRAVHIELVSSLSTDKFLLALRRFIARRGRPAVIYTDNGKNFVGAANNLKRIDWSAVKQEGSVKAISWKFIPPSSPWWGGWWERLIALVKDLLKRVIGRAHLNYEELSSLLCECENIVNSRPITYMSEENDLVPLTPSMFLRDLKESGVPDLDHLNSICLQKRYNYRMKLKEDLQSRFRLEYLGLLRQNIRRIRRKSDINVGTVVLMEDQNRRRMFWPLAKVIEVFPGKDGVVRLVKIKTQSGQFLRPVQRLYPLEIENSMEGNSLRDQMIHSPVSVNAVGKDDGDLDSGIKNLHPVVPEKSSLPQVKTRYGRLVKPVKQFKA